MWSLSICWLLLFKQIQINNLMTCFTTLLELWYDHSYCEVGDTINNEEWSPGRVAEFCAYFGKYAGVSQLNILYKFL